MQAQKKDARGRKPFELPPHIHADVMRLHAVVDLSQRQVKRYLSRVYGIDVSLVALGRWWKRHMPS